MRRTSTVLALAALAAVLASASRPARAVQTEPGVLFDSSWLTDTGWSPFAVTDGGRWSNYWEFNRGSSVQLLSVVPGAFYGHNALRVQQRGARFAANLQVDNFIAPSRDYFLRYYMRNDDTSAIGDHVVTVDTYRYANLTFMRKYGGSREWRFDVSVYGCGYEYPVGHWGPAQRLANEEWYRFEYHIDFVAQRNVQVHIRVYDVWGTLLLTDGDFLQSDYGRAMWRGQNDWTLASFYETGHSFCVEPEWMNDFGIGNNGQLGAQDTQRFWYFGGVQIRSDRWPGPWQPAEK